MSLWLLEHEWIPRIESALATQPTAEQVAAVEQRIEALSLGNVRLETIGSEAQIRVEGPLMKNPNFLGMLFGYRGSSYAEIQAQLQAADRDPSISGVHWHFDTPGGSVDGLFETIGAIKAFSKPQRATAASANSAGYGLASAVGKIEATSAAATFGSVGVIAKLAAPSASIVTIRSTDAPKKNLDASTEEGRVGWQEYADKMHAMFVEQIADGRGVTAAHVNANYGRGATMFASEALAAGMIDSIRPQPMRGAAEKPQASPFRGAEKQGQMMNLEQFKAQHPELYAAVLKEGEAVEASRVRAHLKLGEASGAMELAVKAIREGRPSTDAEVQADYMAASLRRNELAARVEDDKATAQASAAPAAKDQDMGDLIAARRAQLAQKVEA